jgi:hypothetical protein
VESVIQKPVNFSKPLKGLKGKESVELFCKDVAVMEDVVIHFYHKTVKTKMFSLYLNIHFTSFDIFGCTQFSLSELDIVCFDQIDTLLANSVEKRLYPQLLQ